jgi:hypothetical protein
MNEEDVSQDVQPVDGRDTKTGRFLTGNNGGGRKKGSRSKLATDFIAALGADFDEHGIAAINTVRQRNPEVYLKIIGAIIPAKLETSMTVTNIFAELNLRDPQEFATAWDIARQMIGSRGPVTIDGDHGHELEAEHAWKTDGDD